MAQHVLTYKDGFVAFELYKLEKECDGQVKSAAQTYVVVNEPLFNPCMSIDIDAFEVRLQPHSLFRSDVIVDSYSYWGYKREREKTDADMTISPVEEPISIVNDSDDMMDIELYGIIVG